MFSRVIKAEWQKSRHTFIPWFVLIGAALMPLAACLVYTIRWKYFVPAVGVTPWTDFIAFNHSIASGLLFPFLAIVLVAMNLNLENKAAAWKRLFVTPVKRSQLYWGKLVYILLLWGLFLLLFTGSMVISGLLANSLRPALAFTGYPVPVIRLLVSLLPLFMSFLALLTIQYVLCLLFDNTFIAVTGGIILVVFSLVIAQGSRLVVYDPYAYPLLFSWDNSHKLIQDYWLGLPKTEWLSVGYFVLAGLGGQWLFNRKQIR